MKILGIIPARYASSRFPGKPLIDLKGKSMIRRVYEQVQKCTLFTDIVIATDDQRIYDHVVDFKGKVIMTDQNHQSGTERCGEVIKTYNDYDVIINIQGDEPLIQAEQLSSLIRLFKNNNTIQIGTIVKKITHPNDITNPNRIKVVLDKENNGIYFSRSPIPHVANTATEDWIQKNTFYKHIGIYAWKSSVLKKIIALPAGKLEQLESLEQLRWLFNGYKITTVETSVETPNIDTPEDVQAVLTLLENK